MSIETARAGGNGRATSEAATRALAAMPVPGELRSADSSPMASADIDLTGRTLFLPRMPYGGSRLMAAAMASIGIEA
ncbi:MAG TPA: hypothetical protein VFD74_06720, partial [Thermoleophilia bacterium]|nr:hypothetical protein [Thermoleophilia bacterium]